VDLAVVDQLSDRGRVHVQVGGGGVDPGEVVFSLGRRTGFAFWYAIPPQVKTLWKRLAPGRVHLPSGFHGAQRRGDVLLTDGSGSVKASRSWERAADNYTQETPRPDENHRRLSPRREFA
jgi:hypothetical protein